MRLNVSGQRLFEGAVRGMAAATVAGLLLFQTPAEAQAQDLGGLRSLVAERAVMIQDLDGLRSLVTERAVMINEAAAVVRRVGEACIFGATAGAVGAFIVGAPIAANGLAAPSVISIALGAAAVGCVVGFAGASAASGFSIFWERRVYPELEKLPGNNATAVPVRYAPPAFSAPPDGGDRQARRAGIHPSLP